MSSQTQLEFFECTQSKLPDGRIVITPIRFAPRKDIGAKEAARMLGFSREEIYDLCEAGEIDGWRKEGSRTKYRIDPSSVTAYKQRRRCFQR